MTKPYSAIELEVIVRAFYCGYPLKPALMPTPEQEAIKRLLRNDMLKACTEDGFVISSKGEFYVRHLLSQPYPVETFKVPGQ